MTDPAPIHPRARALLDGLNEAQHAAVTTTEGPVLVLAGAGTGKTRVLTTRLAYILLAGKAQPKNILAVTFTNKAAREMRERVAGMTGQSPEGWWLGTFHALGARMLRTHAERLGLERNFTILDTDDQLRLLKQLMQAEAVDEKKWPARAVMGAIQRWKDRGLTPDHVSDADAGDLAGGRGIDLYRQYQQRLLTLNACDFGDLLLHPLTLFRDNPNILETYQRKFQYILVDEYQDTNVAQYLLVRLLGQVNENVCCVGDDDQAIYSWRGAEVDNIVRFTDYYPNARVIRLEENYRSTDTILGAAGGLIANNEGRMGKTLFSAGGEGEVVRVRGVWDSDAEARFVGEEIEKLHADGHSLGEMAVLVRTGAQARTFEERFITIGLPYRVVGGPRFYERQEIRDALAYLRIIQSPDDDLAFERIVNVPKRGLGKKAMQTLHETARARGISLFRAAGELIKTQELRPQPRRAFASLLEQFRQWKELSQELDHVELTKRVLDESGYTEMWQQDKSAEAPGRLENLKELTNAMQDFESLAAFLEHVGLVMDASQDDGGEQVTVMTLHSAKGLEFDTVFLAGWEEGLFPNQRAMDEHGQKGLEEERRLAYVGLTRARKRAIISFCANRRMYGSWNAAIPSRFVDELPKGYVTVESEPGLYGGGSTNQPFGSDFWESGPSRATPGMLRAQQRTGQSARFVEGTVEVVETGGGSGFSRGDRVFHRKFGYGTVRAAEGERLSIAFDQSGEKKVMASFVVAADQAG
ncbi:DNA helicase-2 / ATP-dependent DNA helicase PcrA [Limimonas halophila]|uniref:DNA 3'-5' helicase n=1 Tax=Limimonas halophila TaxID=1082479 RepID=A0A1G7TFW9_9PROT|nr:UvrD-helicase domain-containing protein [Limimonas halophila]SDG33904.1 DNA helicase-2 / ATP-dependent DNA helicase PcrA [Limimonas halophila]